MAPLGAAADGMDEMLGRAGTDGGGRSSGDAGTLSSFSETRSLRAAWFVESIASDDTL